MRRLAAGVALIVLTGCHTAPAPNSIGDGGKRTDRTLTQEPHRAAVCMARNIDQRWSAFTARIRQGVAPTLVEVHVSADRIVALSHLFVSGQGSTAVIWITPNPLYDPDAFVASMVAGC